SGNIYQAGTLSGNPLAMTSGYETLKQLTPESYDYFNRLGDILESGLKDIFKKHNVPITVNRAGSMIGYFLNEGPVTNFEEANQSDLEMFSQMYRETAKEGVFLPPSQFEGTFLSTAHTEADIEKTLAAFDTALSRIV
ncbi:aspartate aminotransferase family protein, partial [Staphylococcus ureilyticus]